MSEQDFEGTEILEKLAEIGAVDAFYEAVDSDDFSKARALLKRAKVDEETIKTVLKMIAEGD